LMQSQADKQSSGQQRVTNTTRRRRRGQNNRNNPNRNPRGFFPTPGRGRGRGRNNNANRAIVGMNMKPYALHHTIKQATIDYAEAVVCPFNPAAIGSVRPDEVTNTSPATDKLQGLINISAINIAFETPAVQAVWPGVTLTGIMMWIMPRSNKSGLMDASTVNDINAGTEEVIPIVNSVGLDANLTVQATNEYNLAYPYILCITFLGSNGNYYAYAPTSSNTPILLIRGYNTISTTRINSINDNFNSLRLLGAGLKVWSNAPPIQTGGFVWGGEMAIQDFYKAFTTSVGGLSSQNIQDALKNRTQYSALDGVTARYNTVVEPVQKKLAEVYIKNVRKKRVEAQVTGGGNTYTTDIDAYEVPKNIELQSKDLATNSTLVPALVWQFGAQQYDITFNMIAHIEGRTVGTCPFELSSEIIDPNLLHLDKILRSTAFPITAKGS